MARDPEETKQWLLALLSLIAAGALSVVRVYAFAGGEIHGWTLLLRETIPEAIVALIAVAIVYYVLYRHGMTSDQKLTQLIEKALDARPALNETADSIARMVCNNLKANITLTNDRESDHEEILAQISSLLEITARALVHPHRMEDSAIRVQCRLANSKTEALELISEWCHPPGLEPSTNPVPYNGPDRDILVISKAFRNAMVLAEEPQQEWHEKLDPKNQWIWSEIRSVLAAPIKKPNQAGIPPIGTISIDSSKRLTASRFDTADSKKLVELIAATVFPLLQARRNRDIPTQ